MPRLSTPRMVPTLQRHILAGNEGARRREHALHAGARIRRAAHHLDRIAGAGIDHADPQPVGVGMLLGLGDARDDERREQLGLVLDALDLEPDHGELVGDLAERMIGVEMLLEPAEGEFHHGDLRTWAPHHELNPPASVGRSSGRKP